MVHIDKIFLIKHFALPKLTQKSSRAMYLLQLTLVRRGASFPLISLTMSQHSGLWPSVVGFLYYWLSGFFGLPKIHTAAVKIYVSISSQSFKLFIASSFFSEKYCRQNRSYLIKYDYRLLEYFAARYKVIVFLYLERNTKF